MNVWIIALLATIASGGVFYAFVYPYLSGDIKAEKRQAAFKSSGAKKVGERNLEAANRRKQVTESLKELEARSKSKKITLEAQLMQAGLTWNRRKFFLASAACGLVVGALLYVITDNILLGVAMLAIGCLGIPRWILRFLRKRRMKKFVAEFPAAIDIIIRGVKAGLPLGDCLRIIANESAEPVRSEFRQIVEAQAMGLSMGEAVERIVIRVPIPEANFFSIVVNIQQKAGGNLSEALQNLSTVLRERKKMQAKIQAMSSEAKASAGIIGALPFVVAFFVWLTSPKYIELLWTTQTGELVLGVCAFWMSVGVFIMKKMISFDF